MARCGSARLPACAGSTPACGAIRSLRPRIVDGTNISVLYESPSGQMWIATYGRGLMRVDPSGLATLTAPAVLPHDNVLAVFEDGEENVWVGTHGGLLRLRRSAASTITTSDGAPSSINTIYEDRDGSLLVAALNGRLFQVARQTLVPVTLPPGLETLPIRNVFRDRERTTVDRHRRARRRPRGRHVRSSGTR